jgi:hypothetical protein
LFLIYKIYTIGDYAAVKVSKIVLGLEANIRKLASKFTHFTDKEGTEFYEDGKMKY